MNNYEINRNTLMIMPISENKSFIVEKEKKLEINENCKKIIDDNCKFFGSSYQGRFEGTKKLLNISHKAPIIIEETSSMIFFPTTSPRLEECGWICLNHIESYFKIDDNVTLIKFYCGKEEKIDINYSIIDNQILRSARLQVVIEKKIKDFLQKK